MKNTVTTLPRGIAQVDLLTAALQARDKSETQIKAIVDAGRSEDGVSRRLTKPRLLVALKARFNSTDAMAILNEACGVNAQPTSTVNTETRRADDAAGKGADETAEVVDEPGAATGDLTPAAEPEPDQEARA